MPSAPPEFKICRSSYHATFTQKHKFDLSLVSSDIGDHLSDNFTKDLQFLDHGKTLLPFTGATKLQIGKTSTDTLSVYVENHFKSEKVYLWFKSKEDLDAYELFLNPPPRQSDKVEVYAWVNGRGWNQSKVCVDLSLDQYVGYQHYYHQLVRQITDWRQNQEKLNKINLQSGMNVMLYGVPGSGKTSLIRLIAQKFKVPIFVSSSGQIGQIHQGAPFMISIWEDFDRYLTEQKKHGSDENSSYMSNLLNTMDGVETESNVIRFFTGNDCQIVRENSALQSRMSATFYFTNPGKEIYDAKIKAIDQELDTDVSKSTRYNELLDKIVETGMSIRELVILLVRHIFHPDPCDKVLDDLAEKFELSKIEEIK